MISLHGKSVWCSVNTIKITMPFICKLGSSKCFQSIFYLNFLYKSNTRLVDNNNNNNNNSLGSNDIKEMGLYVWPQKKGHVGPKAVVISGRGCSSSRGTVEMPKPGLAGAQASALHTASPQPAGLAVLPECPSCSPFARLFCVVRRTS